MSRDEFNKITDKLLAANDKGEKSVIELLTKNKNYCIILDLIDEITVGFNGYRIDLADGSSIIGNLEDVIKIIEVI